MTKTTDATANLKKAVEAKKAAIQDGQAWNGPDNQTADKGLKSLPNTGIAPSGALHAESASESASRSQSRSPASLDSLRTAASPQSALYSAGLW